MNHYNGEPSVQATNFGSLFIPICEQKDNYNNSKPTINANNITITSNNNDFYQLNYAIDLSVQKKNLNCHRKDKPITLGCDNNTALIYSIDYSIKLLGINNSIATNIKSINYNPFFNRSTITKAFSISDKSELPIIEKSYIIDFNIKSSCTLPDPQIYTNYNVQISETLNNNLALYIDSINYLKNGNDYYDYAMTSFTKSETSKGVQNSMFALYNIKAHLPQISKYSLDKDSSTIYIQKDSTIYTEKSSLKSWGGSYYEGNIFNIKSYFPNVLKAFIPIKSGNDYSVYMDIHYKGPKGFSTTIKAPHNFNKLIFSDYEYNFKTADAKSDQNADPITITGIKSYKGTYEPTIDNVKYFYSTKSSDEQDKIIIFEDGSYNSSIVKSSPNPLKFYSSWDLNYTDRMFQKVSLKSGIIRYQKAGQDASAIITKNNSILKKFIFKGNISPITYLMGNGTNYDYAMTSFTKSGGEKGVEDRMFGLYNIKGYLPKSDGVDGYTLDTNNSFIYIQKDNDIVTKKSSLNSTAHFIGDHFNIKSYFPLSLNNTALSGKGYQVLMDIHYKGHSVSHDNINTIIKAPKSFSKLMYSDYKYDFDNEKAKAYHSGRFGDGLNRIEIDPFKGYKGKYENSIETVDYFYSNSISNEKGINTIFENAKYNNPPVISHNPPNNITLNNDGSGLGWVITDTEYIFQKVNLKSNIIRFQKAGEKAAPIITQNINNVIPLVPPEYIKATNYYYKGGILKGKSTIKAELKGEILYFCTSKNKGITDPNAETVTCHKGPTVSIPGTQSYDIDITYKPDDRYLYCYVKKPGIRKPSMLSNSIHLPIVNIVNPSKIGYSNFWPYAFDLDDNTNIPKSYIPVSGGPIEIYNGNNDYNNTSKGYIIYRVTTPKASTIDINKSDIPNPFNLNDYFSVKGYVQDNKTIISLSDIDPFIDSNNKIPHPIQFPSPVKASSKLNLWNMGYYYKGNGLYSYIAKGGKGDNCKSYLYNTKGIIKQSYSISFKGTQGNYKIYNNEKKKNLFYNKGNKFVFEFSKAGCEPYKSDTLFDLRDTKGNSIDLSELSSHPRFLIYFNKGSAGYTGSKGYISLYNEKAPYREYSWMAMDPNVATSIGNKGTWMYTPDENNLNLNISSYGYAMYGNSKGTYPLVKSLILNGDTNNKIDLFARNIYDNGSLIPNYKASNNFVKESSFINYVDHPFYYTKGSNTIEKALQFRYVVIKAVQNLSSNEADYNYKGNNLYMMGIKENISKLCKSDGTFYKGGGKESIAIGFNNLLYRILTGEKIINQTNQTNQFYTIKSFSEEAKGFIINNDNQLVKGKDSYLKEYQYIIQYPVSYFSNTILPIHYKSSNTRLDIVKTKAIYTIAGNGGSMSFIQYGNNYISIAGGGGGSGIYSSKQIRTPIKVFNGNDGSSLINKQQLTVANNSIELKAELNNMDGGYVGVFKGDTLFQLPSGNLGGSIHTFYSYKSITVTSDHNHHPHNTLQLEDYYANPSTNKAGGNFGYYPNFNGKGTNHIFISPVNGQPFIQNNNNNLKSQVILFKGVKYIADSNGLIYNGQGDGGNGQIDFNNINVNKQWGGQIKYNINNETAKYINDNYNFYPTGGGGGGGFGGGSAGTYLYVQNETEFDYENNGARQTLKNIPPGGGGGGNSFYNIHKNKGLAYGINSNSIKSLNTNQQIPSLLPQILQLAQPNIDTYNVDDYLKGKQNSYLYLFTGKR